MGLRRGLTQMEGKGERGRLGGVACRHVDPRKEGWDGLRRGVCVCVSCSLLSCFQSYDRDPPAAPTERCIVWAALHAVSSVHSPNHKSAKHNALQSIRTASRALIRLIASLVSGGRDA